MPVVMFYINYLYDILDALYGDSYDAFGNERSAEADSLARVQEYLQQLTPQQKSDLGYQLDDFILSCQFSNGYPCQMNVSVHNVIQ